MTTYYWQSFPSSLPSAHALRRPLTFARGEDGPEFCKPFDGAWCREGRSEVIGGAEGPFSVYFPPHEGRLSCAAASV